MVVKGFSAWRRKTHFPYLFGKCTERNLSLLSLALYWTFSKLNKPAVINTLSYKIYKQQQPRWKVTHAMLLVTCAQHIIFLHWCVMVNDHDICQLCLLHCTLAMIANAPKVLEWKSNKIIEIREIKERKKNWFEYIET